MMDKLCNLTSSTLRIRNRRENQCIVIQFKFYEEKGWAAVRGLQEAASAAPGLKKAARARTRTSMVTRNCMVMKSLHRMMGKNCRNSAG